VNWGLELLPLLRAAVNAAANVDRLQDDWQGVAPTFSLT